MLTDRALQLLHRSIRVHRDFIKGTLGEADVPFEPLFKTRRRRFDLSKQKQMRLFFKLWNLVNVREKESTLTIDHLNSIDLVLLLQGVLSSSTMLFFQFISMTTSHQPIFMLGSEVFSVTTLAALNVLVWGVALIRGLLICLSYSRAISSDEKRFRHQATDLWLQPFKRGDDMQRMAKDTMIQRMMSQIKSDGHALTFLGSPITQPMVNRLIMAKVAYGLVLVSTWFSSVWETEASSAPGYEAVV